MAAGGIGATSDKIPPRRTSTVTATRPSTAMCWAFQLPGATATNSLRPLALYTTPLDRGSPAGVTWLSTANDARATARHTCSLVSPGRAWLSCSRIVLLAMTAPPAALPLPGPPRLTLPPGGHLAPESSGPRRGDLRP